MLERSGIGDEGDDTPVGSAKGAHEEEGDSNRRARSFAANRPLSTHYASDGSGS